MIEQAVFTAIPAGRLTDGGRLKVTIFVTPKLGTGEPPGSDVLFELAAFEAFANWPRTVTDARWVLEVGGLGDVEAQPLDDPIPLNAELWEQLFGRTSVGEAGFQHFEEAVVHSYPVEEVAKALTDLYQTIARVSPTNFPGITRGPLSGFVTSLSLDLQPGEVQEGGYRRAIKRRLESLRFASGDPKSRYLDIDVVPPAEKPAVALAAAAAFYDRSDDPWDPATATAPAPAPVPPEFHSFIARCADYPELLRHLGLAVDVWIPDDGAINEFTTIRVVSGANGAPLENLLQSDDARPRTLAHYTDRFWAPASREDDPDTLDGSLVIDETRRFLVEQIDPDGSALKVGSLLSTLQRTDAELHESAERNNAAPSMTPDESSLPALRSSGILIARRNRAQWLVRQFDNSAAHENDRAGGSATTLQAADVTRGWRIDIQDQESGTGEWLSLHRRVGQYEMVVPGEPPQPLPVQPQPDEAYLKAASTSSNEAKPTADQYLHETLAGWDGWSLAVRRPGKIVNETEPVDPTVDPASGDGRVAETGFPLAARFTPQPGSLPRLRFGRNYRMRVRAVDLSGESIPADQLDEAHERGLDGSYQRWEPVPSPAVIPLTEYTEGESLMRMVIRSTLGVPVTEYIAQDRVQTLPGHAATGDLGIVYRDVNQRNLAAPIGSVQLAETHGLFDAALGGDPAALAAQYAVAAREAGSFLTVPGGRVISRHEPPTVLDGTKDQRLQEGEYLVHNTVDLPLPYLPDPLSRGISFTTLPGDGGASANPPTRLVRWPGDPANWFDRQPVLVRIIEGDADPAFDADTGILTVSLPKATLVTVRLSSFLDDGDADLMRVWALMVSYPPSPATGTDRDIVRRGLHWMITPFSELTLVHAVEKPLEPPAINLEPGVLRRADMTFSLLPGTVRNHAASTGRIDIDARWEDPVDDVLEPAPRSQAQAAHVADFQLLPTETNAQMWATNGPPAGPYGPRHEVKHEFGDTRHRYVDYTPTATTRFREYFPPEITDRPELVTSVGATLRVNVPSSARPVPPEVKYIVPTWEWQESPLGVAGSPLSVRRVRTGGGLRIYLARPWRSSGPDELLGVVLVRQPWLTWPVDVSNGVLGTVEAQALADGWARQVLEHAGIPVAEGQSATMQFTQHVAGAVSGLGRGIVSGTDLQVEAGGGRLVVSAGLAVDAQGRDIRPPRFRARTDAERFLQRADDAAAAARRTDGALVAATEASVTTRLVTDFLPFFGSTSADGRRFCTVWGMDPVFASESLQAGPFTHQFPLRTAVGSSVSLLEVPGDDVTVVGHTPEFDNDRKLWFCDLQLDAGDAYTPLVQLQLARYQPYSVSKTHLSKTVKTDFIQLLPRREATFVASPDSTAMAVTLRGPVGVPKYATGLPNVPSEVTASRLVEAWAERMPAGATSDLDWEPVAGPVALDVRGGLLAIRSGSLADVEWAGAVGLPERNAGERVRVRIAEYELHEADWQGVPVSFIPPRGRRLVYADEVELP
ncbi:MAG TPA: hypothetical protein VEX88_15525 [Glaciibacter sp.]|nr:hypothetical protein [Glaciibacter sp.]